MSNVYEKLQDARVELQDKKIKKSGKNAYSGFTYYELADILPHINSIFKNLKLCSNFSIKDNIATLQIINAEQVEEQIFFTMPTAELQLKGCTAIQALGGVNTYCKRYLYLNALEIVENDMLDAQAGTIEELYPDNEFLLGLDACASTDEVQRYITQYQDVVKNVEAFKSYGRKKYSQLQKKGK